MVRLIRRFLVIVALMFWQGGFTFYASVVVPIGADVLESHTKQGFITRQVSNWLNVAGGIGLAVLAWDLAGGTDCIRWRRRLRWAAWAVALAALLVLVVLHQSLDALLDAEQFRILDRERYIALHRIYLWTSTVDWGSMAIWLALTLAAWRSADSSHQEGWAAAAGTARAGANP